MATESASDRDNTEIFQQLESYPWEKDTEFQVRKNIRFVIISAIQPRHHTTLFSVPTDQNLRFTNIHSNLY